MQSISHTEVQLRHNQLNVPMIRQTELNIYTFSDGVWKPNTTVCESSHLNILRTKDYFQRGSIITDFGKTLIYLNNPGEDFISRSIHEKNIWEPWIFNTIYKHIRQDPDIGIIDVGANLGAISLQLAKMGRKVISVEAAYQCAQHLCAAIPENGLTNHITVVHNAMGKDHKDVPFVYPSKGEFALGFVEDRDMRKDMSGRYGGHVYNKRTVPVKTATLNDFLTLPGFNAIPKILIKMDVQGFEHNVIEASDIFFRTGKLVGLLMEWTYHRNKTTGDYLIKKFNEWNYEPFDCNYVLKDKSADLNKNCIKMDVKLSASWKTDDIIWLPKKT